MFGWQFQRIARDLHHHHTLISHGAYDHPKKKTLNAADHQPKIWESFSWRREKIKTNLIYFQLLKFLRLAPTVCWPFVSVEWNFSHLDILRCDLCWLDEFIQHMQEHSSEELIED